MITNKAITYYHKILNKTTKKEEYQRYVFENVWAAGGKGSSINKGYENANDVDVRIPMEYVTDRTIFRIGDILAMGLLENIGTQSDLEGQEFYNVTSISINDFGYNQHIHLGGK